MEDAKQLEQILYLLKSSYTCTNTSKLLEISNILNALSKDLSIYIEVLIQGLSTSSINNEQIPPELHESLAINLKNTIIDKRYELKKEEILGIIKSIFELYFPKINNYNLLKNSIINSFKYILVKLLSLLKENNSEKDNVIVKDCENLLNILLSVITKEYSNKDDFIIYAKIVIKFIQSIFESKFVNKNNYVKIINEYYIGILDSVFKNVTRYIDPAKNMYSLEYFEILNNLIEDLFINLKNVSIIESIDNIKYIEIFSGIFKKYAKLILELIKIQIPLEENSRNIFINQNPIISFTLNENEKLHSKLNSMKSKCFQFLAFSIEKLSTKSKENSIFIYIIKDQCSVELFAELTKLIISSLQDILSNKEKYILIKSSKEGIFSYDNNYNNLLYFIFLFLSRCLLRNPIKKEFSSHIKYFILNILFPLVTFEESEKMFIEEDSDTYINYIQDILYDFKYKNFRTALCFLIKKLFENYYECNSLIDYVVQMFMYTFDKSNNNINNDRTIYNIYLSEENNILLNTFNDEIKIDFCFLFILLLKERIVQFPHVLIYKQYYDYFFRSNKIEEQEEEEIKLKIKIKKVFIENMINFLFNLLFNSSQRKSQNDERSVNSLLTKASDTIIDIMKKSNKNENKIRNEETMKNYLETILSEKIRNAFKQIIELINYFSDNISFMSVISSIIRDIEIKEREDIYTCLKILTNKFTSLINDNNNIFNENENELRNKSIFINQYFTCVKNFLLGENKIKNNEIKLFNDIILPVISCVKEPNKFSFYDEIIEVGEDYIRCINDINELSINILDNINPILNKEKNISGYYYSFISTFLSYINMNNINSCSNALNNILNIIKSAYSLDNYNNCNSNDILYNNEENVLYTSLLTTQILSFEKAVLNNEDIKFFILEIIKLCVKYFSLLNNNSNCDESFDDNSLKEKIKQVLLSNFSIFFIFYPDILLNILVNNFMNIFNTSKEINSVCDLLIKLYSSIFNLDQYYYPLLGKCNIICLCSIFSNKKMCDIILNDLIKKKQMFKLVINLLKKQKTEKKLINFKLTDGEIKCDFIECEEKEEESENNYEDYFDTDFNNNIKNSIKNYETIVKCDEFKLFCEIFYKLKSNDENLVNELIREFTKEESLALYNLLHVRNVKVEYNGFKFDIPRRTLKIKRNLN